MDFNYQFEAPRGTRILGRGGWGITTFHPDTFMTWCYARRQWFTTDETYTEPSRRTGEPNRYISKEFSKGGSTHADCRSFKAFKRHLRKHHEKLKGCKVVFCSRWVGHNIVVQL